MKNFISIICCVAALGFPLTNVASNVLHYNVKNNSSVEVDVKLSASGDIERISNNGYSLEKNFSGGDESGPYADSDISFKGTIKSGLDFNPEGRISFEIKSGRDIICTGEVYAHEDDGYDNDGTCNSLKQSTGLYCTCNRHSSDDDRYYVRIREK